MKNFKFTGVNIAAALLILAYFFPWVNIVLGGTLSGFSLTTTGISPGMLKMLFSGMNRFLMVLIMVIPLSGVLILYQNITGEKKFDKYYKPAHFIPAVVLILGLVILYFKMQPDTSPFDDGFGNNYGESRRILRDMTPGLFDILSFGVYITLAASVYLLLVAMGKIKDKEYYKPATVLPKPESVNNEPPIV